MSDLILPGQTIGILGGGQLGRMLAMVARRCGYRVALLTPDPDAPASHFANQIMVADYDHRAALEHFATASDVVTFEFESVPVEPLRWIEDKVLLRPGLDVFETVQNRINEKQFLTKFQLPCSPFAVIHQRVDLDEAIGDVGLPSVLKSSNGGYDGKGQFVIRELAELDQAWQAIGSQPATLEAWVDLLQEVSVIVARDVSGAVTTFGPIENAHNNHILDWSVAPARMNSHLAAQATEISRQIAEHLNLVGLICIEYFVTRSGQVLINEIAPRPHNSGHLTIESAVTCQFEQQLRTVCGLPLGSFEQLRPAAMANLLGDVWQPGTPRWDRVAHVPETYLHLYDKTQPKLGRKMGHITSLGDTSEMALSRAVTARQNLLPSPSPVAVLETGGL